MRGFCAYRRKSMHYILAVFKSRNETLYFFNMFKSKRLPAQIINTPKEAGQACGISVRFNESNLSIAQSFLQTKPFRSFYGFFKVTKKGYNNFLERIL